MKQKSLAKLKKDFWKIFTTYIKLRDKNICFTCGRYCEGSNCHGGHFIKKSVGGIILYFHEDNVHAQCYHCNITLEGNQYEYGVRLGKAMVGKLNRIRWKTKGTVWDREIYAEKIAEYQKKISTLSK